MSDQTTHERDPLRTRFHTLALALECAREARPLIARFKKGDKEVATQLHRALVRCALGIGEASKREGGNKALRFRTARGEANEALVALMIAEAVGLATRDELMPLAKKLDKLVAYLGKLAR